MTLWRDSRQRAAAYRRAERSDAIECDCGRPKLRPRDEACQHCRFLDGTASSEADLIDALRLGCEMSVPELAAEFGVSTSSMMRRLARLVSLGRVTRRWAEGDAVPCVQRCRYGSGLRQSARVNSGRWIYMLCDRRAA